MWGCVVLAAAVAHIPTTAEFENASKPIWLASAENESRKDGAIKPNPLTPGEYAWFRKELSTGAADQGQASIKRAAVLITARHGNDKILAAYKLWINNIPISDGK